MSKHKHSTKKQHTQDREDNRKFMLTLALATVGLMVLMYLIFMR